MTLPICSVWFGGSAIKAVTCGFEFCVQAVSQRTGVITGPHTFSLDGAMQRTFRPNKHFFLDARIDASNLLNHPVFTNWNTTVQSTQFGLPQSVSAMRSLQVTMRVRF